MKMFAIMALGSAALMLLSGCGSLDQHVGGPQLSQPAMAFVDQVPSSGSTMGISYGQKDFSTSKWGSAVYPVFPVFYWNTLGKFSPAPGYGVRTVTIFFPLFLVMRDSSYDPQGKRLQYDSTFNMLCVLWYEDHSTPKSSDFKAGILWIPGLGPFIGAGPEFFQFFWIPFSNYN